jgi:hypothetical protein
MADELILSQNESDNLKEEMKKVQLLLEKDASARVSFFKNPFLFLRQKFNIFLVGFIADSKEKIEDFNNSVRKLFDRLKEVFNECFACKLSALIIIYGLLAKYGVAMLGFLEIADQIISKLDEFFGNTSKRANDWIEKLKNSLDEIKPSTLALRFCQDIGLCRPIQTMPVYVGVPPSTVNV